MLGMISTTKHKRIVAEKDAEIAGLEKLVRKVKKDRDFNHQAYQTMCRHILAEQDRSNALRARLAPFTKIRARDSRGRFIKDTVA